MQDPIYRKIEDLPRPTIFAASAAMLLAAVGLWLSSLAEQALGIDGTSALAGALYYLPFMALPVALCLLKRPGLGRAMRLNPLPVLPTLAVALLALLSVYVASVLAAAWGWALSRLGLNGMPSVPMPQTRRELMLAIVCSAALPAVCEELLFRGFALAAWESRGTWYALGVTSLLFALLHGNLYGLPVFMLVGATAAFVTFALDSLYAGIVYHTVYNAACLILPWALGGGDGGEFVLTGALLFSMVLELAMQLGIAALLAASLLLRARSSGIMPIPRIRRPLEPGEKAITAALLAEMLISIAAVVILGGLI